MVSARLGGGRMGCRYFSHSPSQHRRPRQECDLKGPTWPSALACKADPTRKPEIQGSRRGKERQLSCVWPVSWLRPGPGLPPLNPISRLPLWVKTLPPKEYKRNSWHPLLLRNPKPRGKLTEQVTLESLLPWPCLDTSNQNRQLLRVCFLLPSGKD